MSHATAVDDQWAAVATATRGALRLMGWPIESKCLPGEPDHNVCGHGWAQHAAAHLTMLDVIARHQLRHLHPPADMLIAIAQDTETELRQGCQLEQGAHFAPEPGEDDDES